MSQLMYARSANPDSTGRVSLNSVHTSMVGPDEEADHHIFLLLCITVNGMSSLEQLNVRSIENDKYLFDKIREAYHRTHAESAWHQKIALTKSILSRSGWLSQIFRAIDLTVPHSISFVRFHLVPVGMDVRPWNFRSPDLPPEVEVIDKKTYHYAPCPIGGNPNELNREVIHSLLQPDKPHLDRFWLDLFPKKLKEQLLYKTGSTEMCSGWGIHIVEGVNKLTVVLLAIALLGISGVLGIVYTVVTRDASSGFAIATFVGLLPALGLAALQLMPVRSI